MSDIVRKAFRFITQRVHTLDDTMGAPNNGINTIPALPHVLLTVDVWVRSLFSGEPCAIEKSRRITISWIAAALEVWLAGWRRSTIWIAAQDFADSAKMLYRSQFIYEQLRLKNPSWRLSESRTWEYSGPRLLTRVMLPNGSVFESLTGHDPNAFRQEGATVIRLEEAAHFPLLEDIMANAQRMCQPQPGMTPGMLVTISTPSDLPHWDRILREVDPSIEKPEEFQREDLPKVQAVISEILE